MNRFLNVKNILIIIILLIIMLIATILCIKKIQIDEARRQIDDSTVVMENNTNSELEQDELKKLQTMSERDRMEFYFSKYTTYIEDREYEKAYNLLYPEFKSNYFPTLERFEEYVKNIYPEFMTFSYNNIDRQGYIYVLNIDIIDIDNKDNKKSHRVVIQENDFNDFVLSFQVI